MDHTNSSSSSDGGRMTDHPEVDLANEIIWIVDEYNMQGLEKDKCVEAVEVAAAKLKEDGWKND